MVSASDRQAASLRENPYPKADVLILRKNHWYEAFNADTDSNTDRGTALLRAIALATDGDTLVCSAGTFDLGTSNLDLSLGGTATVHLRGAGKYATIIQAGVPVVGSLQPIVNSIVHPGLLNCVTEDLTIKASLVDGSSQSCWGCFSTESAFTNAQLNNCYIDGQSDGIYIKNDTACTCRIRNVDSHSTFDAIAVLSGNGVHEIEAWASTFVSDGTSPPPYSASGTVNGCRLSGTGTILFFDCHFKAIGGTGTSVRCSAVYCPGTNANIELIDCRMFASNAGSANACGIEVAAASALVHAMGGKCVTSVTGGGSAFDVRRSNGTLGVGAGLYYTAAKASGTITYLPGWGVTPTSGGLTTLSS